MGKTFFVLLVLIVNVNPIFWFDRMERVAWIWFWIKHAWYRILFRTGAKLQTPFYTRNSFNPSWIRQNSAPCNWYITLFVSEWIGRYWFMKIPLQIKSRKKSKKQKSVLIAVFIEDRRYKITASNNTKSRLFYYA